MNEKKFLFIGEPNYSDSKSLTINGLIISKLKNIIGVKFNSESELNEFASKNKLTLRTRYNSHDFYAEDEAFYTSVQEACGEIHWLSPNEFLNHDIVKGSRSNNFIQNDPRY